MWDYLFHPNPNTHPTGPNQSYPCGNQAIPLGRGAGLDPQGAGEAGQQQVGTAVVVYPRRWTLATALALRLGRRLGVSLILPPCHPRKGGWMDRSFAAAAVVEVITTSPNVRRALHAFVAIRSYTELLTVPQR